MLALCVFVWHTRKGHESNRACVLSAAGITDCPTHVVSVRSRGARETVRAALFGLVCSRRTETACGGAGGRRECPRQAACTEVATRQWHVCPGGTVCTGSIWCVTGGVLAFRTVRALTGRKNPVLTRNARSSRAKRRTHRIYTHVVRKTSDATAFHAARAAVLGPHTCQPTGQQYQPAHPPSAKKQGAKHINTGSPPVYLSIPPPSMPPKMTSPSSLGNDAGRTQLRNALVDHFHSQPAPSASGYPRWAAPVSAGKRVGKKPSSAPVDDPVALVVRPAPETGQTLVFQPVNPAY